MSPESAFSLLALIGDLRAANDLLQQEVTRLRARVAELEKTETVVP